MSVALQQHHWTPYVKHQRLPHLKQKPQAGRSSMSMPISLLAICLALAKLITRRLKPGLGISLAKRQTFLSWRIWVTPVPFRRQAKPRISSVKPPLEPKSCPRSWYSYAAFIGAARKLIQVADSSFPSYCSAQDNTIGIVGQQNWSHVHIYLCAAKRVCPRSVSKDDEFI